MDASMFTARFDCSFLSSLVIIVLRHCSIWNKFTFCLCFYSQLMSLLSIHSSLTKISSEFVKKMSLGPWLQWERQCRSYMSQSRLCF
jgi:hypothetical protein